MFFTSWGVGVAGTDMIPFVEGADDAAIVTVESEMVINSGLLGTGGETGAGAGCSTGGDGLRDTGVDSTIGTSPFCPGSKVWAAGDAPREPGGAVTSRLVVRSFNTSPVALMRTSHHRLFGGCNKIPSLPMASRCGNREGMDTAVTNGG
jgi:hypothetical protein